MKVKITMTEEEFESYRVYQCSIAAARAEVCAPMDDMRERLNLLCNALLYATREEKSMDESEPCFSIIDQSEMKNAVELAEDWVS